MNIPLKHSGAAVTIFSEMSALAQKYSAVNLSQGFPDYEVDFRLKKLLGEASERGFNQYAPLAGNPLLIDNLISFNKERKKPLHFCKDEITVTPGATYGIYTALATILRPGDEVIVFEPCYDSYVPSIEMNGGVPVFVALHENFELNWEDFQKAISVKTKAVIVNSPHNPTGKVWNENTIAQFYSVIKDTEIIVISDEVYDLLVYDDHEFYSIYHHPELKKRCFSIFSFGKMFDITGWKVGYIAANPELMQAFRRVHQYLTFCVSSVAQQALAKYLEIFDADENRKVMQQRRDYFVDLMKETPFVITDLTNGSYFQTAKFRNINADLSDKEFAVWLTEKHQVATIPISAFYHDQKNTGSIRFCFAKKEETIKKAVENLKKLG